MDPPGCTLILLQHGGPRREPIATSLWEPTGWINRHLPGIDPRPMTGKKCGAADSLPFMTHLTFPLLSSPLIFLVRVFHFETLLHVTLDVIVICDSALMYVHQNFSLFRRGNNRGCC